MQANSQDGSGTNNANFATPPDGSRPRMRMYYWTGSQPYRDGDFEAGIGELDSLSDSRAVAHSQLLSQSSTSMLTASPLVLLVDPPTLAASDGERPAGWER